MNKEYYIKELSNKLNCDMEYARNIESILDEFFIIGKENKEKAVKKLVEELNISEEEADNIYNVSRSIIASSLKNRIIHPFGE